MVSTPVSGQGLGVIIGDAKGWCISRRFLVGKGLREVQTRRLGLLLRRLLAVLVKVVGRLLKLQLLMLKGAGRRQLW